MKKNNLVINIENKTWIKAIPDIEDFSNKVLNAVFDYVKKNKNIDFLKTNKPLIINLLLSGDKKIRFLNKEYRNKDKATNVLSFAAIDNDDFNTSLKLFDEIELGDIIISLAVLKREAKEKDITLENHYAHLLTHGILHLLGFDHIKENEADYMEDFEIKILKTLNINNPYKE